MSFDMAKLRLLVDSSGLVKGGKDLDTFVGKAKKVDAQAKTSAASAAKMVKGFAALGAALGLSAAFSAATRKFEDFNVALGEVATLVDATPERMAAFAAESRKLSDLYGGDLTKNTNAFYSAVSAGAATVEDATAVVAQANKLAVGGVTTVDVAVDGLTSAINAYADDALSATDASDAMFVGMRLGKTTIAELSASLGKVAPLAQKAGLSFDELIAGISITTKAGINTAEAVSGLKAALANVIKPTADAANIANKLGLEFSASALEGKGLVGFLDDVRTKTGGSTEALSALFGSIEGANVIMALAGSGFKDLAGAMDEMSDKAGDTDDALQKVMSTLTKRFDVASNKLQNMGLGMGELGLQMKVFAAETLVEFAEGWRESFEGLDLEGWSLDEVVANVKASAGEMGSDIGNLVAGVALLLDGQWAAAWERAGMAVAQLPQKVGAMGLFEKISNAIFGMDAGSAGAAAGENASKKMMDWWAKVLERDASGAGGPLTVAQEIGMGIPTAINNGMAGVDIDTQGLLDSVNAGLDSMAQVVGTNVAAGIDASLNAALDGARAAVQAKAATEGLNTGTVFGENVKHGLAAMDEAVRAAAEAQITGAGAAAQDEARAAGMAVGNAYNDGVAASMNAPNGGNGYAGATGGQAGNGSALDRGLNAQYGIMPTMKFQIYIPEKRPMMEYFEFVEDGIGDVGSQIKKFSRDYSGSVSDAIMAEGATNPQQFWESFKQLSIDSFTGTLEAVFAASGPGTQAIGKGLETIMVGYVDLMNRGIANFNNRVDHINPADAVRRMPGGSLLIQTQKFRSLEYGAGLDEYALKDSGIQGRLGGDNGKNTAANLYALIEKTRKVQSLGDSEEVKTYKYEIKEMKKLKAVEKLFSTMSGNILDTVTFMGDAIGGETGKLGKVIQKFSVSFGKNGKATEAAATELANQFGEYSDKLAKKVLKSRGDLKNAGEDWSEALERLSKDFVSVTATMLLLGQKQIQKASLNNAKYASALADMFGGEEAFSEAAGSYFDVAYSDKEQKNKLSKYIDNVLAGVGIKNAPDTRDEYRALVEKQDLSKAGGREKYATLVSLADMFDQILPAFGDAVDEVSSLDGVMSNVATTLSSMVNEAEAAAASYERLGASLASTANEIRRAGMSDTENVKSLRAEYNGLFKLAKNGDMDAMGDIQGIAKSYSGLLENTAKSAADYRYKTAVMANQLDKLSDVAMEKAALSYFEAESLQALQDGVENGKITNNLVQTVVDTIGTMDNDLYSALNQLYKAQTGKKLNATKTSDEPQVAASSRSYDVANEGDNVTVTKDPTKSDHPAADEVVKMRKAMMTIMRRELRAIRRGVKFDKSTSRTLKDWDQNGMPT